MVIKITIITFFLLSSALSFGQIIEFPDSDFKNALVNTNCVDTDGDGIVDDNADTNNDGEIEIDEAQAVISLNLYNRDISSLIGIEYFENIEILSCSQNQLAQLDLSQNILLTNLNLRNNLLTTINISQNTNLEGIEIAHNNLQNIDISQNINLLGLECSSNNLSSLDISQNTNLLGLACSNNSLNELDVTSNLNLKILDAYHNNLSSIDLTNNSALERLWLNDNFLTDLDVSQNPLIWRLHVDNNLLSNIDLFEQTNLITFTCSGNQFVTLDLSQNNMLRTINCSNNNLSNLNIQNGNNENLNVMLAVDNPNLLCIQVDDENSTPPFCSSGFGWCVDNDVEFSESCVLSIDDINNNQMIVLYPNPVKDYLSISTKSALNIIEVNLYNTTGELVYEEKEKFNNINLSKVKKGIYFIVVRTNNSTFFEKIIKQ
ncbi:T9SS type A sorting domain-containing protein [Rasiella rasia]|uniref:T9SS type A sorting domain-containing protein n=1 Tax=Rasiella rasia TaxID=2744027 RepID=A0A6G6GJG4_9FLAO|nr:T9SS type A sorting domain-containing protein [Rasiella rasia]QIE58640.1 T9SS type A sorting domain-containing protein [Rasiella rasia]